MCRASWGALNGCLARIVCGGASGVTSGIVYHTRAKLRGLALRAPLRAPPPPPACAPPRSSLTYTSVVAASGRDPIACAHAPTVAADPVAAGTTRATGARAPRAPMRTTAHLLPPSPPIPPIPPPIPLEPVGSVHAPCRHATTAARRATQEMEPGGRARHSHSGPWGLTRARRALTRACRRPARTWPWSRTRARRRRSCKSWRRWCRARRR